MNSLSAPAVKSNGLYFPLISPLNPRRPYFPKPTSFRNISSPCLRIKSSSHDPKPKNYGENPKLFGIEKDAPGVWEIPVLTPLKTAAVTTIAAAAVFFSRFYFQAKPSIAASIPPVPSVETSDKDSTLNDEKEKSLEERLVSNPGDIDALKNLVEVKITSKKIPEAIQILNKLMELEPDEIEWPMLKSHLHAYSGEFELAKNGFNELIHKDPFRVEAYHGLLTVASNEESNDELREIEKRVHQATELCKEEKKEDDLRDFKLLTAQIKVLQSEYDDALKVYEELVNQEPRDYRPYLCQGIIYTLLRKSGEAEKSFAKYRTLVPKDHPYAGYFDDNMIATKAFAQRMENERAVAKS